MTLFLYDPAGQNMCVDHLREKSHRLTLPCVAGVIIFVAGTISPGAQMLNHTQYHLGVASQPEWKWFEGRTPFSNRLDIHFQSEPNTAEGTLFITQDDVKLEWPVQLNGRKLGTLFLMEQPLVHTLAIPPGTLKKGDNVLSVFPPGAQTDDIIVGDVRLDRRPVEQALRDSSIDVEVSDTDSGEALPCRITIIDENGRLAALHAVPGQALATRPGVVYTGNGHARLGLLPGKYTIFANRGFEYGLARQELTLHSGDSNRIQLRIALEVPTPGLVSCDTHVHTFTYARHGDATIEERILTLVGEGIELPISTEHNRLVDFREPTRRLNAERFFTPVIGCEVTTDFGHFNAFPIEPAGTPPDHRIRDWPKLLDAIRSTPGVQVVVLNHPRDVHSGFEPFAATNFNPVSGENLRGPDFTFDALEVINSAAMQSDWMQPFRDWFALLNHGTRVTAVASSDSHDVSRFIVGQGRTYIRVDDSDPARIAVAHACQSLRHGRALVSLGLLTSLTINERFAVGDLATNLGDTVRVQAEVFAPSWIEADHLELSANGVQIRESRLESRARRNGTRDGNHWVVTWNLPRPSHDCFLVAIASGPGATAPYWSIARPFQPTSHEWNPRVIGATNPIWLDVDGDGQFSSAHAYAASLIERFSAEPSKLLAELAGYDEPVCVQCASLCSRKGLDMRSDKFERALKSSPEIVRHAFTAFAQTQTRH